MAGRRFKSLSGFNLTPQNKVVVISVAALGLGALLLMWQEKDMAQKAAIREKHRAL